LNAASAPYVASGARPVVDDKGLAPFSGEPFAHQPRQNVGDAAGRVRHDHPYGAGGVGLGAQVSRQDTQKGRKERGAKARAP